MVAAMQLAELRREQVAIAGRATAEMLAVFGSLNFRAVDLSAPGFVEAAVSVAERTHAQAHAVGADMYLSMRRDAGVAGQFQVARPVFDSAELRRGLIVLGPIAAKKLMSDGVRIPEAAKRVFTLTSGRVSKTALAGVRDTISGSTVQDSQAVAYARQTSSGACDFCVMLAGNTYRSAETAMQSGGRRKRNKVAQPAGEPFHDHCRCALVTIFQGQLPDGGVDRREFSQAWHDATQQGLSHDEFLGRAGLDYLVS